MKLPGEVLETLSRYVEKCPVPHGEPGDVIEQSVREWTNAAVEQVVFEHPGQGWGSKRADGGRPQSKDAIANNQMQGGRLLCWDLVSGAGTGNGSFVGQNSDEADITGQVFIAVIGVDHLGGGQPPRPDPQTPVPTSDMPGWFHAYRDDVYPAFARIEEAQKAQADSFSSRFDAIEQAFKDQPSAPPIKVTPEIMAAVVPMLTKIFIDAADEWVKRKDAVRFTVTPKKK
jgi:hypothetical protein